MGTAQEQLAFKPSPGRYVGDHGHTLGVCSLAFKTERKDFRISLLMGFVYLTEGFAFLSSRQWVFIKGFQTEWDHICI